MKTIVYRISTHPIIAFAVLVALVGTLFSIGIASRARAADVDHTSNERLITLHDRGIEKGILTKATTLREAFKQADIYIDPSDLVEPGLDEKLTGNSYEVNVYRARPVTIIDGSVRQKVMTPYQTAVQITKHANIKLYPEDKTVLERLDAGASQGVGLALTITRATPFTLTLYGKKVTARTQAKTVGDMLKEKGIRLGKDEGVSVPSTTPIIAGMNVSVWRNGVQTITQEEEIPMPVRQIKDMDQEIGYKQVQTAGKPGKKEVTYEINLQNGVEVSRKVIQSVETTPATEQVEVVGGKVNLPPGSHEDWMAAAGIAPSDYGYVNYIVSHEGGWVPCKVQGGAINCDYSGSLGYGIVQATPGSKMASVGADWRTNPITQLKWATGYAVGRYGSWEGAYNYWTEHHWW